MKRAAMAAVVMGCTLISCRAPWTVRPIDANEPDTGSGRRFDAAAYAASIWESRVVPAALHAPDFAAAVRAGHPTLAKGIGRVLRIDAAGQRVLLDVAPYDGKPDAQLPTGGISGTALRDALPFIQFSQFVNQVDFAHAANALDSRAAAVASAALRGARLGTVLSFAGALDLSAGDGVPEIVPVVLTREPERP